ncbi:MAG: hypothetical protein AB7K24_05265 [Gemmataceae bacterium]
MRSYSKCLAFLTVALVGCGQQVPSLAPVNGTVRLNGHPVPNATVKFYPLDSATEAVAAAVTDASGVYSLRFRESHVGAPPGQYKVVLSTERADVEGAETFPEIYHNPEQTQLIVTVPEGGATLDLEAKTDG